MRRSVVFPIVVLLACSTVAAGPEVGERAPDFVLMDADDREHSLSRLGASGKAVLLIMGNRKIRKEHEKWAATFKSGHGDEDWITAFIVVDMRSAPAFAPKSLIKRKLGKNRPPVTLLLDWRGKVHQQYGTRKDVPNLYLIDPHGRISLRLNANLEPETSPRLERAIDDLRRSKGKR